MCVSNMIAWSHAFQPVYRHYMPGHISWSQGLSEAMKNLNPESRNFLPSNPHNYQCHQNPFCCLLIVKWLAKLQSEMPLSPDVRETLGKGGCALLYVYTLWFYMFYFSVRPHIIMVSHQFPFVVMDIPLSILNTRRFSSIRLSVLSSM
jgi:hypothetical protein